MKTEGTTVFSSVRTVTPPDFLLHTDLKVNTQHKMDGRNMMHKLPNDVISTAFFDPQYRGILDKMHYGNEGKSRAQQRCSLEQMSEDVIKEFFTQLDRVLIPSGHIFLWIDKFHLCSGFSHWLTDTLFEVVDMITWDKQKMGMGYRTRRVSEYIIILQKKPQRAKGIWKSHDIKDVWQEKVSKRKGVHPKPIGLQRKLIEAVTTIGDIVLDPAAGSFSVMTACQLCERKFLGCDINGGI